MQDDIPDQSITVGLRAGATGPRSRSCSVSSPSTPVAVRPAGSGGGAAIQTHASKFGTILTDGSGRSVYRFESDTGTASTCYHACAAIWPPVMTTGSPIAIAPAMSALLGTTPRQDGGVQVTYAGHPLYYYYTDQSPGDVTGENVNSYGALWDLMKPSGADAA